MTVQALRDVLSAASSVTDLVPASRITPLVRTQSHGLPAITLQRVASVPQNNFVDDGGLDAHSVQLDVYASTYELALEIAAACREALDAGFQCDTEIDSYDSETDPELYRITQQWSAWS